MLFNGYSLNHLLLHLFVLKGDTSKQALKHICQRLFNFWPITLKFLANASFFRRFEWRNQIWSNTTAQCTFCIAQRTYCTVFPTREKISIKKDGKTVQNVHCTAVLGQIWLRHSNCLEKRSISWKCQTIMLGSPKENIN